MSQYSLSTFVDTLNERGHLCDILLHGTGHIEAPCSLAKPRQNGFCFYGKKRWKNAAFVLTDVSLILTASDLDADTRSELLTAAKASHSAVVATANPRLAFMALVGAFFTEKPTPGLHPDATVPDSCTIDESATICAGVRLGPNVTIGARSVVRENSVILAQARVGADCYIGPGTSIGQPGFGYERDASGAMIHFPHIGSIQIGDRVEIGSNTCIDRGTLDDTIIHDGVKIDNLCHISHNVVLHEDAVVIANSMVGGSVAVGPRAWLAPSCSVINGVSIGADAMVGMCSSVTKPVPDATTVLGVPATEISDFMFRKKKLTRMLDAFEQES